MKTQQINQATRLGRTAHQAKMTCIPWEDEMFMETLKKHQAHRPGSASFNELLDAWLNGWYRQHSEKYS